MHRATYRRSAHVRIIVGLLLILFTNQALAQSSSGDSFCLAAPAASTDASSTSGVRSLPLADDSQALLEVADQPMTDGSLVVQTVITPYPSWLVVYVDQGGKPYLGRNSGTEPHATLGRCALRPGSYTNILVPVSVSLEANAKSWLVLQRDEGLVGAYEFPGPDAPTLDSSGNVVMRQILILDARIPAALPDTGASDTRAVVAVAALIVFVIGIAFRAMHRGGQGRAS